MECKMYDKAKNIIVLIVAIALTLTSASMTILGYTSLYAENVTILAILFIVLETTKATIFGIVFVSAKQIHKAPLLILAIALIIISFIGHLSYLSKSYNVNKVAIQGSLDISEAIKQSAQSQMQGIETQIQLLQNEIQVGNAEIEQMRNVVNDLQKPNARHWAQGLNKNRIAEITNHNANLSQQIQNLYKQREQIQKDYISDMQKITTQSNDVASRSVFTYTAEMFGITQDKLANIINVILSLVIDSLALIMLWVAGDMWREYRESTQSQVSNETKNKAISTNDNKPKNTQKKPLNQKNTQTISVDTRNEMERKETPKETQILNDTIQTTRNTKDDVSVTKKQKELESEVKPPPLFTPTQKADVFGRVKELKSGRENITRKNLTKYFFEGNSVNDAIAMSDEDFNKLKERINTIDQLQWMELVASMRT